MDINTENVDPRYWERVLRTFDLGMNRGVKSQDVFAESTYCAELAARGRQPISEQEAERIGMMIDHEGAEGIEE